MRFLMARSTLALKLMSTVISHLAKATEILDEERLPENRRVGARFPNFFVPDRGWDPMRKDASDRESVHGYVEGVRGVLNDPRLQGAIERAAAQLPPGEGSAHDRIRGLLAVDLDAQASSGGEPVGLPYLSRSPFVSLLQSHVEEARGDEGLDPSHPESLWSKIVRAVEREFHIDAGTFTPGDVDWYVFIAKGVLERLAQGNHPFNPAPAEWDALTDDARLVVVGDWGTGLPRARDVATHMRAHVADALAEGRQVHVIHLGDVYYSGLESEDRRRFLDLWPVTPQQAGAVKSWSLNGNHDMYSGGFGYFTTLLGDARFSAQRSPDGKASSFFRLRSPSWDLVGLDTAWDDNVVSTGRVAVLKDPQAEYVSRVAADSDRKMVLFSHHQLVSIYDVCDLGTTLGNKLASTLKAERVKAWWWGHEHRAITYAAANGVHYPRCLGNGGVPVLPDPDPPAGGHPSLTWHSSRTVREDGQDRTRFGFAMLDLHPDRIYAQYIDDDGVVAHTDAII
jgi:hypothetical protein